jgi:hypothetical protein
MICLTFVTGSGLTLAALNLKHPVKLNQPMPPMKEELCDRVLLLSSDTVFSSIYLQQF